MTEEKPVDILIVGAGTAGLSAGIYGARARRATLILEKKRPGGQAATTERMDNYPGFPGGIGGRELLERFRLQAEEMGCAIRRAEVGGLAEEDGLFRVDARPGGAAPGGPWRARSLILAPGCEPRRLGIPGERELIGRGVSYCATCDAELYEGARVVVVGSGDTAVEEAIFISRFAGEVLMVVVHDEGVLDCNRAVAAEALANPKLKWLWNRSIAAIEGGETVEKVRLKDLRRGREEEAACEGVFLFVGTVPQTQFLAGFLELRGGYLAADERMETARPLVFAAGDARAKTLRQVVTAASDGAVAAFYADRALSELDEYARARSAGGVETLLYFYTPPVQRSLDLFPEAERRAAELALPLVKLDTYRFRSVAQRLGVREVPALLRVERETVKETLPL